MPRESSPAKLREWTERLKRFAKSNQTVVDFCSAEAVSQPSFYQWKRRLAPAARTKTAKVRRGSKKPANPSPRFQPVFVTPREDAVSVRIRLPDGAVIELGEDILMIEKVVDQLLGHQPTLGADAC